MGSGGLQMRRVLPRTLCLALSAVLLWNNSLGAADFVHGAMAGRGPAGLPAGFQGLPRGAMLPAARDDSFGAAMRAQVHAWSDAARVVRDEGRYGALQLLAGAVQAAGALRSVVTLSPDLESNAFLRMCRDAILVSERAAKPQPSFNYLDEEDRALPVEIPMPAPGAQPVAAGIGESAVTDVVPAADIEAAVDRILVIAGGVRPIFGERPSAWRSLLPVFKAPESIPGAWRQGDGIRYRISYLGSLGINTVGARGMHYRYHRNDYRTGETLPERYWGDYAIYERNVSVTYRIEIENTSGKDLGPLQIMAYQEAFNASGGAGRMLSSALNTREARALGPGERTVIGARFTTAGSAESAGSFEQTHLTVSQLGKDGTRSILADDAQAGLVDPPTR